mmetsp:Transcript_26940/g.37327  ORF Transcript_26940/g.37327 Transcript_26940/m.37327 type:complete len:322 (+) Transcript_26940:3-968(+)
MDNSISETKERPHENPVARQRLKAWQPIVTPQKFVIVMALLGALLLSIGAVITSSNASIQEVSERYDNRNDVVTLQITEEMDSPMRFSYSLTNYYQNFRLYVKSRSDWQLADVDGPTDICTPLESFNGTDLYPCGLVANSFFNDTFEASYCPSCNTSECTALEGDEWQRTGISWHSDRQTKFNARALEASETNVGPAGFPIPFPAPPSEGDNEDFVVWMRAAGLPTFRKLYSKVDRSFSKGDCIRVNISNNYPVDPFGGTKTIILEEVNWMNGRNNFLGALYIVFGCFAIFASIGFGILQHQNPRKLADPDLIPTNARVAA